LLIPCVLVVDGAILLLAMTGRAALGDLTDPGRVVLELGLSEFVPQLMGALLMATILAIIVSTADSFLLSSSSSLLRDVYQRFINPQASQATLLRAARVLVVLITAGALALSFSSERFFDTALFAYTLYGVGITPVLLAALFWRRATPAGAVASMLCATSLALVWKINDYGAEAARYFGQPEGSRVGAVIPSILVASVVLVTVSLMTKPRPTPDA
jgi:SSS family solute:Na+ symporter/sodium/proline symporter